MLELCQSIVTCTWCAVCVADLAVGDIGRKLLAAWLGQKVVEQLDDLVLLLWERILYTADDKVR